MKLEEFLDYIPKKDTFVLFGADLSYSISKDIHNMIFEKHNLNCEYIYVELNENQITKSFCHLKKYFKGANITIPFKTNFIQLLDEVDETAKRLNSVNTIKVDKNNKTIGYNTDILGIINSFEVDNIQLTGKKVALLGSGATANVLADVLCSKNADLTILSRNTKTSNEVKENTQKNHKNCVIKTDILENFDNSYDIICNATPVGMNKLIDKSPVSDVSNANYIFDVIYNPFYTKLVELGLENNIKTRNGLRMLLVQAYFAEKIWNNIELDFIEEISSNLEIMLSKKRIANKNIVLIGFMGSGKTYNGIKLSNALNFSLFDSDNLIVTQENTQISEIFEKKGEKYFRYLEHKLALELSCEENKVISLGGGFPIDNPNMKNLQENSIVVFIDTDINIIKERISNDKTRPLSKNFESLYNQRYEKYLEICDVHIKINEKNENIYKEILRRI